jgi:hypothetical protein
MKLVRTRAIEEGIVVTHPPKLGDDEGGHSRQNRRNFTEDRDVKMMGHGSPKMYIA